MEDNKLRSFIQEGLGWKTISKQLNDEVHSGYKIRNSKQCKERWNNHLNTEIKKGGWSDAEDFKLVTLWKNYRNMWTVIAEKLENRTPTAVKNRTRSLVNGGKLAMSD